MRMRSLLGRRYKERPSEAVTNSLAFMLRGGYVRNLAPGLYSFLPPAKRIARKIEDLIRVEIERLNGQEVLIPAFLSQLEMSYEEAAVNLCRNEITSYRQLPAMIYQIQRRICDRTSTGRELMGSDEFTSVDGYSFHCSDEDLKDHCSKILEAYIRVLNLCGLPEVAVSAFRSPVENGGIGTDLVILCEAGSHIIAQCNSCSYCANHDFATSRIVPMSDEALSLEKVHTPKAKTIEEVASCLGVRTCQTAKAVFYETDSEGLPVFVVIRGDLDVDERKLSRIIRCTPQKAQDSTIEKIGAVPGYASPLGLNGDTFRLIIDHSAVQSNNLVCGANEVDYHYVNYNATRDTKDFEEADIFLVRDGDTCPICDNGTLNLHRGICVGSITNTGTAFTKDLKMEYLDQNGSKKVPLMSHYTVGVESLIVAAFELNHDEHGPLWPLTVSPWQVHINVFKYNKPEVAKCAEDLYKRLGDSGIEAVIDDRNERPGVQFADADLLGVPVRLIVSSKNLEKSAVELSRRGSSEKTLVPIDEILQVIEDILDDDSMH